MIFSPEQDTVARPNELLVECWRDYALLGDLDGGADRMRWRGQVWLPQEHQEEPGQYTARVARSDLYPGLASALDEVSAQPFAKPVDVQELPPELEPLVANVDGDGNDLTQVAKSFLRSAAKYGRAHIFVDFSESQPTNAAGVMTRADEQRTKPRAFWRIIEAPSLLGWRTMTAPNGQVVLSEVRIHEIRTEPDGQYGERKAEYIRVIRPNNYELWKNEAYKPPRRGAKLDQSNERDYKTQFYDLEENRGQDWKRVTGGSFGPEGGFDSVPVVTLYTGYVGFMRARSPFSKLAETNLTHWQSSSDQRNIAHCARVPILFGRGFESERNLTIGAGTAIVTQNPDAFLEYVEHTGQAMQLGQDDLEQLERRMEQLGVRPHVERSASASATGAFLDAEGAATDIQAWAQACDSALEQCFDWTAKWMGIELPEEFDVQIFKDYAVKMNADMDIPALQQDVKEGRIQHETYLREAMRRGLYGDDLDIEAELKAGEEEKQRKEEMASELAKQAGAKPGGLSTKPKDGEKPNPVGDNQGSEGETPS